jgi:hypothetical protein
MTRVLLVGLLPETVDYSDPALPSGMNAKKIQAGIELGLKQKLATATYDCIVIGAAFGSRPRTFCC